MMKIFLSLIIILVLFVIPFSFGIKIGLAEYRKYKNPDFLFGYMMIGGLVGAVVIASLFALLEGCILLQKFFSEL